MIDRRKRTVMSGEGWDDKVWRLITDPGADYYQQGSFAVYYWFKTGVFNLHAQDWSRTIVKRADQVHIRYSIIGYVAVVIHMWKQLNMVLELSDLWTNEKDV